MLQRVWPSWLQPVQDCVLTIRRQRTLYMLTCIIERPRGEYIDMYDRVARAGHYDDIRPEVSVEAGKRENCGTVSVRVGFSNSSEDII